MCVSRIMRKRINEELDENCIIQPGRVIPKEQYVRRRAYTKQHKSVWEAAIKKYKHVKCIFQNCHFLALSVEDMIFHFGYCNGDGSFAKFTCPYCQGRVTSEKILEIHMRRSHECEQYNIINNHFLDLREDSAGPVNIEEKQFNNDSNDFRTLGENEVVDVKVEGMGCDYDDGMVSQDLFIAENQVLDTGKNLDYGETSAFGVEYNCSREMEVEETVLPEKQRTELAKPGQNEKYYSGDHIYSKRVGQSQDIDDSNSISVMKTNNLKHYSGPRNISVRIINGKSEEGSTQDLKIIREDGTAAEKGKDSLEKEKKSHKENDNREPFARQMVNFSIPSVQNTRRRIDSSYTYIWTESIKTNGFARCLVATCNFISLDIFHVQNHFKTCSGVPANGPNLCTLCNSWLPSAVELSIHSERCKTYRELTDSSLTCEEVNDGQTNVSVIRNCEEKNQKDQTDSLDTENSANKVSTVAESDPFQIGKDNENIGEVTGKVSKKEKSTTLRISDILKLKESGNMDINRIVQPGPVLPKDQYLRRRAYTKQHKAVWEAAIKRYKHIICIFQNCYFVAMSVEDMIYHFGYCIGDGSFAKFQCPHCYGRLTSKMVLDIHIKMSHPQMVINDSEGDSEESVEEGGSSVYDILSSVEELKKLVTPREIKTYGRSSMHSKMIKSKKPDFNIKSELYAWCENNDEPFTCVDVILDEKQPDLVSSASIDESTTIIQEISSEECNEQKDEINDNLIVSSSESQFSGKDRDSKCEKNLEKSPSMIENLFVNRESEGLDIAESLHEKSLIVQDVISVSKVNHVKKSKDDPEEVEDHPTNRGGSDQERTVEDEEKTSERNHRSKRGEKMNGRKSKSENSDSFSETPSRRNGRHEKSPHHSPSEVSEAEGIHSKSRRGTKKKSTESNNDKNAKIDSNPKIAKLEVVEDVVGRTKKIRKRGRPPKNASTPLVKPVEVDEPPVEPIPDVVKKGRRGRKRKIKEEIDNVDESTDNTDVKCAKCDFKTKRQKFSNHNFRKHVGLSWIEGDPPLDTTDEVTISSRIKQAFKVVRSATCETCNSIKKSALGFISHIQNCGKSEEEKEALKITCPYCPSRILKYSLPMHLKLSHSDSSGEGRKAENEIEVLTKRRSAIRAANKFQEVLKHSDDEDESKNKVLYIMYEKSVSKFPKVPFKIRRLWRKRMKEKKNIPCCREGCAVESINVQDAKRHHFTCSLLPEKAYLCQFCHYHSLIEDDIREHVNIHPNMDGDFTVGSEEEKVEEEMDQEDVDEGGDYVRNKSRLPENAVDALEAGYKIKFFARENLLNGRQINLCRQSLRMMLNYELEEVRDVKIPLFELHANADDWTSVSPNSVHKHLPSLEESMMFTVTRDRRTNIGPWRKLCRFEGEVSEGSQVMFTGGSVLAMSWCKISSLRAFKEKPRQYLAVSSSKDMRKFQDIHEISDDLSGCIQIWDCGELGSTPEIPKMAVAIVHDSGQVWDLSWFPTDTYEESTDDATRIGLLGAACQDGTIRIWPICDPHKLKNKFKLPLYRTEPKVILQQEGNETVGCLRLAIGKAGIVVGGFANGMVAIWNLKAMSSPFCRKTEKTFVLKPYLSFQAHRTSITALSICPRSDRYIATSGLDRFLRLWDLECVLNPIESTLREVCLDNAWPRHWPLTISMFEDVIPYTGKGMVKAIRDAYCDKHRAPLTINDTCWSLSINDWMNIISGCNSRGEVKIRYMRNMFMADEKFRLRTGHLFSSTELGLLRGKESESGSDEGKMNQKVESNTTSPYPRTYEEGHLHFGLIFKDYVIRDGSKQESETKNKKVKQCMEEYPITSINKVSWNPNFGSFKFLAIGHQSGFVRIRQLEDIRCEEQVVRFFREAKDIITKL